MIRNIKVANRARRYRAATGFDATGTVEQQYVASASCKVMGGGSAGGTAANDDDIELFMV